jgi:hypothetical protein
MTARCCPGCALLCRATGLAAVGAFPKGLMMVVFILNWGLICLGVDEPGYLWTPGRKKGLLDTF